MADVNKKRVRIWVMIKRLDLTENGCDENEQLREVTDVFFDTSYAPEEVIETLRNTLNLSNDLILKLRNHRGSLIPINSHITSNTKSVPYVLEVVRPYQHVKPRPRSIKNCKQVDALLIAYNNTKARLDHIETNMPEMMNKRHEQIIYEVEEMEKTLNFLEKRLKTAEDTSWQGMFKRHPFW